MPRRPGGKYKGLITRAKSEDTLALEAEEKEARARARALQRAQDLKKRQATNEHSLKSSAEEEREAKMEKIMNLLMGGKKSAAKFFSFWQIGMRNIRKERAMRKREFSWRASCVTTDVHDGHCHACDILESPEFLMPFEYIQKQAKILEQSRSTGMLPIHMHKPGNDPRLKNLNRRFSSDKTATLAPPPGMENLVAQNQNTMQGSQSAGVLPALPGGPGLANTTGQFGLGLGQTRERWLPSEDKIEIGFHYSTGRPVKFDTATMRMEYLPTTNDQAWRQSILPGADKRMLF